jgi:hypothetical protein
MQKDMLSHVAELQIKQFVILEIYLKKILIIFGIAKDISILEKKLHQIIFQDFVIIVMTNRKVVKDVLNG